LKPLITIIIIIIIIIIIEIIYLETDFLYKQFRKSKTTTTAGFSVILYLLKLE